MVTEVDANSALLMDRGIPLGNSSDAFGRRSLHSKIGNKPDEAIPVYVTAAPSNTEALLSFYNEVSSVGSGSETDLVIYTVPVGQDLYLERLPFSGTNIAQYRIKIDGITRDSQYTYFGSSLSGTFDFSSSSARGLKVLSGSIVKITVQHQRPMLGDFNGRIQGVLVTE